MQRMAWRLHDPVLEKESFLGASLTQKLLQQLQLPGSALNESFINLVSKACLKF